MKSCHLSSLFVVAGLFLSSCAGPAPTSQPNATATFLARAALRRLSRSSLTSP
jgi:hypothetical protein